MYWNKMSRWVEYEFKKICKNFLIKEKKLTKSKKFKNVAVLVVIDNKSSDWSNFFRNHGCSNKIQIKILIISWDV